MPSVTLGAAMVPPAWKRLRDGAEATPEAAFWLLLRWRRGITSCGDVFYCGEAYAPVWAVPDPCRANRQFERQMHRVTGGPAYEWMGSRTERKTRFDGGDIED